MIGTRTRNKNSNNFFFFDTKFERHKKQEQERDKNKNKNKNANNRTRTKTQTQTNYEEKKNRIGQDRIEPVSRAEALIPDDVNLSRSGSFDTGYGGLDDATSGEGR